MKVYKLDNLPSQEQYIKGFKDIEKSINQQQLNLLQQQYYAPDKMVTATQLAKLAQITGGRPVVNSLYGRLGHLLSDAIGFKPSQQSPRDSRWWNVLSIGYSDNKSFFWQMYDEVALALEELDWVKKSSNFNNLSFTLPEELSNDNVTKNLYEGAKQTITVNRYERNNQARQQCIDYYGTSCYVCGFDFEKAFGELGKGFIHVHHLTPLSEIDQEYQINPIEDLRPVCPNCHAMIHKKNPPFSIEEVKTILNKNFQHND